MVDFRLKGVHLSGKTNAGFKKFDLHIHTPASFCYGDKSVRPEKIVEAAVGCGMDAIAITDHNTFASINGVRRAAKGLNLTIFPGAELTTKSGHF